MTVPADLMAIGNMPVAPPSALPGELKRVRFATTPRMSTYLLFFGLGDFERVHRDVAGVDVGVIVKRGDTAQAAYALDAAARILPYYNAWFGTPYPLPKLDMVAGAGGSVTFGAMENWGAIFYFERDLLIDPTAGHRGRPPPRVRDRRARDGAPVVRRPRDDGVVGRPVAQRGLRDVDGGQGHAASCIPSGRAGRDGRRASSRRWTSTRARGTHPVIMHIDDVSQTEGAFDTITYSKGSQVVRTLEATMGDDAFRDGVRRYIARARVRQHRHRRPVARARRRTPPAPCARSRATSRCSPACR